MKVVDDMSSREVEFEQACDLILQTIGEKNREGLSETPKRFAKALAFHTKGYYEDPKKVLKVFEDGADNYDEMVLVKDIPFFSKCEHHLETFFGVAHIAYIPDKRIVGLSKLPRLVEIFARRLQVQERMTVQIADALVEHLGPIGVGVVLKARHMCMESRGIQKIGTYTTTSALRGCLKDEPEARAEFFSLIKG